MSPPDNDPTDRAGEIANAIGFALVIAVLLLALSRCC